MVILRLLSVLRRDPFRSDQEEEYLNQYEETHPANQGKPQRVERVEKRQSIETSSKTELTRPDGSTERREESQKVEQRQLSVALTRAEGERTDKLLELVDRGNTGILARYEQFADFVYGKIEKTEIRNDQLLEYLTNALNSKLTAEAEVIRMKNELVTRQSLLAEATEFLTSGAAEKAIDLLATLAKPVLTRVFPPPKQLAVEEVKHLVLAQLEGKK